MITIQSFLQYLLSCWMAGLINGRMDGWISINVLSTACNNNVRNSRKHSLSCYNSLSSWSIKSYRPSFSNLGMYKNLIISKSLSNLRILVLSNPVGPSMPYRVLSNLGLKNLIILVLQKILVNQILVNQILLTVKFCCIKYYNFKFARFNQIDQPNWSNWTICWIYIVSGVLIKGV